MYNAIDIKSEVLADKYLIDKKGYEITWVFLENCKPSGPLLKDLENAKIIIKYLP